MSVHTAEPPARFGDLLASEWIKLRTLRSTPWALGGSALALIGFHLNAAYRHHGDWPRYDAARRAEFVPNEAMLDAFGYTTVLVLMLTAASLGALTVVGEYSSGLIRTTFAAVPARRSVMAAKAAVVTAVTTCFAAVVAGVSFALTQAVLAGRGAGLSIGDPGVPRALAAATLLAPVAALAGIALGTLIRHTAATLVLSFLILLVLPGALSDDTRLAAVLHHAQPVNAWLRLVELDPAPAAQPWTVTGAWTVYALWALIAAAVTVVGVRYRDQ